MTNVGNILLDKEILLESGTNELEVLVFNLADFTFGINVAKVREVLPATRITELPRAHASIRGVFKLRDRVIPCVSLMEHLAVEPTSSDSESTMILSDFNQQQTAFLVDGVERIHRLSWENILGVPGLAAFSNIPVTAVARCEQRLIVMLDFEMIIDQVTDSYFNIDEVANPHNLPREELTVLLADDSATVREAVSATLKNSGYTNLRFFENGADAWSEISRRFEETGTVEGVADLLISDVEMPQIDGFHLTKKIKEHPQLKRLPVLLYSSIVTADNVKKGKAVGADAQISKPELNKVVGMADDLIRAARGENGQSTPEPTSDTTPGASAVEQETPPSPVADIPSSPPAAAPTDKQPAPAPESAPAADEKKAIEKPPTAEKPTVATQAPVAESVPVAQGARTAEKSSTAKKTSTAKKASPPKKKAPATKKAGAASSSAQQTSSPPKPSPAAKSAPENMPPASPLTVAATPAGSTSIKKIDSHLWRTFHTELRERVPVIQEIIAQVDNGAVDEAVLNEAFRLLHTIKSAAMVVPINEITRVTHLVEDQLEDVRNRSGHWPLDGLRMYGDWLGDLASNVDNPQRTLALGPELEKLLAAAVEV